MLLRLRGKLQQRGISLRLAEAHASVRELLRAEGLDEKVGPINRFVSVADLVEDFQQQTKALETAAAPELNPPLRTRLD